MSMLPCMRKGDWKEVSEVIVEKIKELTNSEPGIRASNVLASYLYWLLSFNISRAFERKRS